MKALIIDIAAKLCIFIAAIVMALIAIAWALVPYAVIAACMFCFFKVVH